MVDVSASPHFQSASVFRSEMSLLLLADQIERLIALRDAEWAKEDIATITWSGEARRGAIGMDKLRLAIDKLGRTQADNYRAIRENK